MTGTVESAGEKQKQVVGEWSPCPMSPFHHEHSAMFHDLLTKVLTSLVTARSPLTAPTPQFQRFEASFTQLQLWFRFIFIIVSFSATVRRETETVEIKGGL